MGVEKKKTTNKRLLITAIVVLMALLVLFALYSEILGNKSIIESKIRVACVGDSITEGSGYPSELWMKLGIDYIVKNFGVGGSTVLLASDKPYMNQTAFEEAKNSQPDVVVVMLGTNDAIPNYYQHIDNFVDDYKTLLEAFKTLDSNPKIWLVLPPPIYDDALGPNGTNLVQGVLPRIEQVANQMSLPLINIYEVLNGHPECYVDGVHLTREGVQLLVNEIYVAINDQNPDIT